jgi:hypothetical protein
MAATLMQSSASCDDAGHRREQLCAPALCGWQRMRYIGQWGRHHLRIIATYGRPEE